MSVINKIQSNCTTMCSLSEDRQVQVLPFNLDTFTPLSDWRSLLSVHHLLEMKFTFRCYNGQLVAQVIVDQVTDAVKQHVFSTYLTIQKKTK